MLDGGFWVNYSPCHFLRQTEKNKTKTKRMVCRDEVPSQKLLYLFSVVPHQERSECVKGVLKFRLLNCFSV